MTIAWCWHTETGTLVYLPLIMLLATLLKCTFGMRHNGNELSKKIFFFSVIQGLVRLCDPPKIRKDEQELFPGIKSVCACSWPLTPSSVGFEISGAIPPLSHTYLWHTRLELYLYYHVISFQPTKSHRKARIVTKTCLRFQRSTFQISVRVHDHPNDVCGVSLSL